MSAMKRRGTYEEYWGRPVWVPDPYDDEQDECEYSYEDESRDREEAQSGKEEK